MNIFWNNSVDCWHRKLTLKYNFGTFWRTINRCRIVSEQFPLSMLILVQKAWISRPTIFKIPPPNWHYAAYLRAQNCAEVQKKSVMFALHYILAIRWGICHLAEQEILICMTYVLQNAKYSWNMESTCLKKSSYGEI